jgi:hypothetical protein
MTQTNAAIPGPSFGSFEFRSLIRHSNFVIRISANTTTDMRLFNQLPLAAIPRLRKPEGPRSDSRRHRVGLLDVSPLGVATGFWYRTDSVGNLLLAWARLGPLSMD